MRIKPRLREWWYWAVPAPPAEHRPSLAPLAGQVIPRCAAHVLRERLYSRQHRAQIIVSRRGGGRVLLETARTLDRTPGTPVIRCIGGQQLGFCVSFIVESDHGARAFVLCPTCGERSDEGAGERRECQDGGEDLPSPGLLAWLAKPTSSRCRGTGERPVSLMDARDYRDNAGWRRPPPRTLRPSAARCWCCIESSDSCRTGGSARGRAPGRGRTAPWRGAGRARQ